jgi:hypothetical protein
MSPTKSEKESNMLNDMQTYMLFEKLALKIIYLKTHKKKFRHDSPESGRTDVVHCLLYDRSDAELRRKSLRSSFIDCFAVYTFSVPPGEVGRSVFDVAHLRWHYFRL